MDPISLMLMFGFGALALEGRASSSTSTPPVRFHVITMGPNLHRFDGWIEYLGGEWSYDNNEGIRGTEKNAAAALLAYLSALQLTPERTVYLSAFTRNPETYPPAFEAEIDTLPSVVPPAPWRASLWRDGGTHRESAGDDLVFPTRAEAVHAAVAWLVRSVGR